METAPLWLPIAFFLIALFYATVGFGGGSSYLAVLALAGLPYQGIPPVALACNLIVASGGLWHFCRAGYFKTEVILPFVVFSVPMAYLGGKTVLQKEVFCLLLGLSLLAAALRMFLLEKLFEGPQTVSRKQAWMIGLPGGALLGFLSGLVGVGGGIFLSPLLLLMRWVDAKEAACAGSLFIVANSLAGLWGRLQNGTIDSSLLLTLGLAVFVGGQIGSRLGAYRIPKVRLQQLLGGLILYVSVKLIWEAL